MNFLDGLFSKLGGAIAGAVLMALLVSPNAVSAQPVSFDQDVFPILELRCIECHQPGTDGFEKSGLNLLSYEGLMKGTSHGPVVAPRSAKTSNLIAVIDHRTDKKIWMPHDRRKLSKCERRTIRFWINQGAQDN